MNTRRNFLKSLGVSVGIAASANPIRSFAASTESSLNRVGVLLPTSTNQSNYSESFINGLNLAFKQQSENEIKYETITETVKLGYPSQALKKAKNLIENNRVNTIVGLLNTEVAGMIAEITQPENIPIFIANAGENIPTESMYRNSHLYYSSLDLCNNAALSGQLAVEKFGKRVAVVSDLHDCGYDTIYAFQNAVSNSGGEITNVFIKKEKDESKFFTQTFNQLVYDENNALYLLMNKEDAITFLRKYHALGLELPIITTPFVTEEYLSIHLGSAANNLYHVSPWIKELENRSNIRFVKSYEDLYFSSPDQFSFLGYQTGLTISELGNKKMEDWPDKLIQLKNSPTGTSFINPHKKRVENPAYLCKTKPGRFSTAENSIIANIDTEANKNNLLSHFKTDIHSGWLNPYLFV